MRKTSTFWAAFVVCLISRPSSAQTQGRVETPAGGDVRLVSGTGAPNAGDVTHQFYVQRNSNYLSMFKMNNAGRIGIGEMNSWELRSSLNVGTGMNGFSVDNFAGTTVGAGQNTTVGSACIGFNASRQPGDTNYPDGTFYFGANGAGTKNGGALIWSDVDGGLNFSSVPSTGGGGKFLALNTAMDYRTMKISPSGALGGQVQIGRAPFTANNATHADFKLAVDGKIVAKSVYVTQLNWADFVFAPTYRLMPLPELEQYLQANRHLPAIPSAQEVATDGVNVGAMQANLLQTVEELTLHVIELSKQNQQLQVELRALAAKVNQAPSSASSR